MDIACVRLLARIVPPFLVAVDLSTLDGRRIPADFAPIVFVAECGRTRQVLQGMIPLRLIGHLLLGVAAETFIRMACVRGMPAVFRYNTCLRPIRFTARELRIAALT